MYLRLLIHPSSAHFCYAGVCFIVDSWVFIFSLGANLSFVESYNPDFPLYFLHISSRPVLRHKEYFILALILIQENTFQD